MFETPVLRKPAEALFALLFPDDCRLCGKPLTKFSRVPVCPSCLKPPETFQAEFFCVSCRTPFVNSYPLDEEGRCTLCRLGANGFDSAYSFGSYEGRLRELVHLFKYGRVESLARPLGEMAMSAFPREEQLDAIVPMPMHWLRRWKRGFNQAERLARHISRRTGLPVWQPVSRRRSGSVQAGLSSAQRRQNVTGAFHVKNPARVRGSRLLLVDDVFTTGATAGACARTLKRAGAERVVVLTLARTDRRYSAGYVHATASLPMRAVGAN